MKLLDRKDIPDGYFYYRSHSEAYVSYEMKGAHPDKVILVKEEAGYGYIRHFFGGWFSFASFEKSDIQPTKELLARYGMKRGIIIWSGWRTTKPTGSGWWKLGYLFSRKYHHSTRSAFSVPDIPEYWKKWSSNARGHRNKIHKEIQNGNIYVDTQAKLEDFIRVYRETKVRHGWKKYLISRQLFLSKHFPENVRIFLAYADGICLAGAIFLDDFPTSTYLIAFQNEAGKKHHLGLALIDAWFMKSQKLGYRYLDLDHMRDMLDPFSYAGYTQFKSEIADYELSFRDMWLKITI